MSPNMSVLVLGAGELGSAVLEALAVHPKHQSITVLLRPATMASSDPTKRAEITKITALGISTIPGDVVNDSEEELAAQFSRFHAVIACTGMSYPRNNQIKIARAVLAARVTRYFPWQFGVDYDVIGRDSSQDLFDEQLDIRALLRSQRETKWVIVSTGMFTSFVFWPPFGVVSEDRRTVRSLGSWENRVTVTTPRDIGRVVAEIVWAAPEVQGVVYTAGETLSYGRLADIVEQVTGQEVKRVEQSVEMLKGELAKDPDDRSKKYSVVFAEGKGVAWDKETTFNAERGMELQGVEDWFRANVA